MRLNWDSTRVKSVRSIVEVSIIFNKGIWCYVWVRKTCILIEELIETIWISVTVKKRIEPDYLKREGLQSHKFSISRFKSASFLVNTLAIPIFLSQNFCFNPSTTPGWCDITLWSAQKLGGSCGRFDNLVEKIEPTCKDQFSDVEPEYILKFRISDWLWGKP